MGTGVVFGCFAAIAGRTSAAWLYAQLALVGKRNAIAQRDYAVKAGKNGAVVRAVRRRTVWTKKKALFALID